MNHKEPAWHSRDPRRIRSDESSKNWFTIDLHCFWW